MRRHREIYETCFRQAAAFLDRYEAELPARDKRRLSDFAALLEPGFLRRADRVLRRGVLALPPAKRIAFLMSSAAHPGRR
jgi:hypothetical protein